MFTLSAYLLSHGERESESFNFLILRTASCFKLYTQHIAFPLHLLFSGRKNGRDRSESVFVFSQVSRSAYLVEHIGILSRQFKQNVCKKALLFYGKKCTIVALISRRIYGGCLNCCCCSCCSHSTFLRFGEMLTMRK